MRHKNIAALILAAGKGTRMKSDLAKVLHPVCGKPMLHYSIGVARKIGAEKIAVVVGHQADLIRQKMAGEKGLAYVLQKEQLGTGHAVLQARSAFRGFSGLIVILCGDVPLLKPSTVQGLMDFHLSGDSPVTVLTTVLENPASYGRIIKEGDCVTGIVEFRDASAEQRAIREINTGIYCCDARFLFKAVTEIRNDNVQHEYYLTDIVAIAAASGKPARALAAPDPLEVMGINTKEDLSRVEEALKRQNVR